MTFDVLSLVVASVKKSVTECDDDDAIFNDDD